MADRCSYCGKTKKQHHGVACVDVAGFKKLMTDTPTPPDLSDEGIRRILDASVVSCWLDPEQTEEALSLLRSVRDQARADERKRMWKVIESLRDWKSPDGVLQVKNLELFKSEEGGKDA